MRVKLYGLLILLTALSFFSCQDETPSFRIGISQCSLDAWHGQMNREMEREAWIYKNVQLDIRSAHNDNRRQIQQIDSLVEEGVDLLIISPNEARALTPIVDSVMNLGIPVVLVDRKVVGNHYTAYIGADNRSIGRDIGIFLVKELKGKGSLLELTGSLEGTAASERHEGMHDVLDRFPDIHTLARVEVGWEGPRIHHQLDSLFRKGIHPDIILAPNDRTGVRIYQALVELGHSDIDIVGVDGLFGPNGGLENVEQGKLLATFLYPTRGDKVIQTAMHILQHKPYKKNTQLRTAIINDVTMQVFRMQRDQMKDDEARITRLGTLVEKSISRAAMQNMLHFACIAIILLIVVVLAMGIRSYNQTICRNEELNKQKKKLERQHDEMVKMAKELEESTKSKLTFFSEVSHDLRTPLTLILAPTEQLLKDQSAHNLTPEQRSLLQMVRSNADTLMHLVQCMLDFRKYEEGNLRLNLSHIRLDEELKRWCKPFGLVARKKMMRLSVTCQPVAHEADYEVDVDIRKMESIVYNLLINAFKYTPEGGKVSVTCGVSGAEVKPYPTFSIIVEDTGKGIESEKIPHIFDRYYQTDVQHDGAGIGLAMVKAFVELHGGTVRAESILGVGTRFIVVIPVSQTGISEVEKTFIPTPQTISDTSDGEKTDTPIMAKTDIEEIPFAKVATNEKNDAESAQTAPPILLVVDDNDDIRAYIRQLLQDEYTIEEASDGQEGLEKARQLMPDIVVCDIMMPVMDGLECCKQIKEEWRTAHIPVVLLTACSLDEQRAAGYHCGADAYISKPFTPDMLRVRLRNLIDNRRRVKAFFGEKGLASSEMSTPDKGFAERFRSAVEANLSSADLSVEDLASEMGMGRTQLYRKIKSLTGLSPVEVVRTIRLKKAAELLQRTEKSVSEIAYEVGFSSPGYLSKCFKEYFGVNPKDYK